MSRTHSPSSGRPYGLARVCRVWRASRATIYRHLSSSRPEPPRRPGPVGPMPDAALVEAIRAVTAESSRDTTFRRWRSCSGSTSSCWFWAASSRAAPSSWVILPIFIPTAKALGIDLVHFGVVAVFNIMIGLITPPYGLLLFIISAISGAPLRDIIKPRPPARGKRRRPPVPLKAAAAIPWVRQGVGIRIPFGGLPKHPAGGMAVV